MNTIYDRCIQHRDSSSYVEFCASIHKSDAVKHTLALIMILYFTRALSQDISFPHHDVILVLVSQYSAEYCSTLRLTRANSGHGKLIDLESSTFITLNPVSNEVILMSFDHVTGGKWCSQCYNSDSGIQDIILVTFHCLMFLVSSTNVPQIYTGSGCLK